MLSDALLSEAKCPRCGGPLALSDERPEGAFKFTERYRDSVNGARAVVYGACEDCDLLIEDVALSLAHQDASRSEVLEAMQRSRRARALFDKGRGDPPRAMAELARAFHALRRLDPPGLEPWAPDALYAWLQEGRASHHERACAHFILSVWDSRGPAGTFDAMAALAGWDRAHRAAFLEWAREPWWP